MPSVIGSPLAGLMVAVLVVLLKVALALSLAPNNNVQILIV
jgi:hypothetical protein